MPPGSDISVRGEGTVASVLLSRPPLNILNLAMMEELSSHLERLAADEALGVVVLESELKDVFSAGADVREHLPATAERLIRTLERVVLQILAFPRPTVAIVRGKCLGGGMELAMACDFVLASDRATFGQPEISVGVFPPVATALYPRLVGLRATYDVVLTGRTLTAAEAASMGFVTSVHSEAELDAARQNFLGTLTSKSRAALQQAKRAALEGYSLWLEQAM
ncbi:MAG TPA: enoyl-CoA hydratase/isomerase family protein, partial [bacterium]|nr:enoyl-CoA hydratase/isomerase family protein [bacterium]